MTYQRDPVQQHMDNLATTASDLEWWRETKQFDGIGLCGGCGWETCHPDQPCGDVYSVIHGKKVCDRCETRHSQGVRPPW